MIVLIDRVFVLAHPAPHGRTLKVGGKSLLFFFWKNCYYFVSSNVYFSAGLSLACFIIFYRRMTEKNFLKPKFSRLRWSFLFVTSLALIPNFETRVLNHFRSDLGFAWLLFCIMFFTFWDIVQFNDPIAHSNTSSSSSFVKLNTVPCKKIFRAINSTAFSWRFLIFFH